MSALAEPLFELQLGHDKVRLAPKSLEEFDKWIEHEHEAWTKVFSAEVPRGQDPSFLGNVHGAFKDLSRAKNSTSAASSQSGGDRDASIKNAMAFVDRVFNTHGLPLSGSVRGKLVLDACERDPFAAKTALFVLGVGSPSGQVVSITSPSVARGLVLGSEILSAADAKVGGSAVRKLVAKGEIAIAGWDAEHQRSGERINATHRSLEEELSTLKNQREEERTAHQKLVNELKAGFESELKSSKETLEQFQDLTRKDIALKAPTEYWRGKAIKHRRNAAALFVSLVLAMLAFAYFANELFPKLVAGGTLPGYGNIAVLVVVATLAFWVLRILVRLFFSQIHLAQDAQERVTMVTTYLALVETGKFEKDNLSVVLNALFRTAADGIVKDEGMPPSFWEIVTRQSK